MVTRCRWLLHDLGGYRKAQWCPEHDAYRHPWACFAEDGTVDCVCGLSDCRVRPAPPVEQVA